MVCCSTSAGLSLVVATSVAAVLHVSTLLCLLWHVTCVKHETCAMLACVHAVQRSATQDTHYLICAWVSRLEV